MTPRIGVQDVGRLLVRPGLDADLGGDPAIVEPSLMEGNLFKGVGFGRWTNPLLGIDQHESRGGGPFVAGSLTGVMASLN